MFDPDAIRRKKKRTIDHEQINKQKIIDNAVLSKFRTLKVL